MLCQCAQFMGWSVIIVCHQKIQCYYEEIVYYKKTVLCRCVLKKAVAVKRLWIFLPIKWHLSTIFCILPLNFPINDRKKLKNRDLGGGLVFLKYAPTEPKSYYTHNTKQKQKYIRKHIQQL